MEQRPRIPSFGVPERIPVQDVPFIVAAGLPLVIVLMGIVGAVSQDLGIRIGKDNPISFALVVLPFGLGPALAYHFQVRLRSSGTSYRIGCATLVLGVLLLALGGFVAGYVGAALGASAGIAIAARRTRRLPSGP